MYGALLADTLGGDRRVGAADDDSTQVLKDVVRVIADQSNDLATLVHSQVDERKAVKGTVEGLTAEDEELVLLARACDSYSVAVCPGMTGRHLYAGIKGAAVGAGGTLRRAGWTQCVTNRLALSLAGGYWGGRTEEKAGPYDLLVTDFVPTTAQELDEFIVPTDDHVGDRPKVPAVWEDWLKRARRAAAIWALVYGEEWREPLMNLVTDLEKLADEHPTVFPQRELRNLMAELMWRFWEELRETLRRLKQEIGRDQVKRSDLIAYALMPDGNGGAWLKMPDVFELRSPSGWFRTAVLPRIERKQQRAVWGLTWNLGTDAVKSRRRLVAGGNREEGEERTGKGASRGRAGTGPGSPVYPAGKALSVAEIKLANDNKPLDDNGKPLCWMALTH